MESMSIGSDSFNNRRLDKTQKDDSVRSVQALSRVRLFVTP